MSEMVLNPDNDSVIILHKSKWFKERSNEGHEKVKAAGVIQRVWRGHLTRMRVVKMLLKWDDLIYPRVVHFSSHRKQVWRNRKRVQGPPTERFKHTLDWNCQIISLKMNESLHPAMLCFRIYLRLGQLNARVRGKAFEWPRPVRYMIAQSAALTIQKWWRCQVMRRVYLYLKDGMGVYCREDPASILRLVNPREASLLDQGHKVHMRFRMAGIQFPPDVVYKIYTHMPVVDLGAISESVCNPEAAIRFPSLYRRKATVGIFNVTGLTYERIDNNGWRLFRHASEMHLKVSRDLGDPVACTYDCTTAWKTKQGGRPFPATLQMRRKQNERIRKQKRVTWLEKMTKEWWQLKETAQGGKSGYGHTEGPDRRKQQKRDDDDVAGYSGLEAREPDALTGYGSMIPQDVEKIPMKRLVALTARGMAQDIREKGPESVEDWEVSELLEWAETLDFETYWQHWEMLYTSVSDPPEPEPHSQLMITLPVSRRSPTPTATGVAAAITLWSAPAHDGTPPNTPADEAKMKKSDSVVSYNSENEVGEAYNWDFFDLIDEHTSENS